MTTDSELEKAARDKANELFLMEGVSMDVADNNDKAVIGYGEKCFLAGAKWQAERLGEVKNDFHCGDPYVYVGGEFSYPIIPPAPKKERE